MEGFKIIRYTASGKAIIGQDERGYDLYLCECIICQKSFGSLSASAKYCSDECRNYNKNKIIKDKNLKDNTKTEVKNSNIKDNKYIIDTSNEITTKIEAEDLIIKYIKKYNYFPYMNDLIYVVSKDKYITFSELIKKFFGSKEQMKKILKYRYKKGEFKIISHCKSCDKEIDITYSSSYYCSKECKNNKDKHLLECVVCNEKFYSLNITERCCSVECQKSDDIKTYQIRLCELGYKIVKKCSTCKCDFIADKYSATTCDKCKEEQMEYRDKINKAAGNSYYKKQKYLYEIICKLLPSYNIEYNKFYSFLDGLQLDVYIPDLHLAFEYDGEQHYNYIEHFHKTEDGFEKQKKRDLWKNTLCKKNNIDLLRIRYDEHINWKLILYKLQDVGRQEVLNTILDSTQDIDVVEFIEDSFNIYV